MSYFEDFEEYKLGSIEFIDCEYFKPKKHYVFENLIDIWKTKEGKMIELNNMTTKHLTNSKNMIEKICNKENWDCNNYKIYNNIIKELKNRK